MRTSTDHILTSHVGSLPRPDDLIGANRAREAGEPVDEGQFQERLRAAVADVVRRQRDIGIDVPGDGEYGKSMGHRIDYGVWMSYCYHRLDGLDFTGPDMHAMPPRRSRPGEIVLTGFADRRDRVRFAEAFADPESGITIGRRPPTGPVCVGPLTYTGHAAIAADTANLKAALAAAAIEEGFMTAIAPGATTRMGNTFYKTQQEFLFASAEAMREEYKAILDAGLVLQLDDPALATDWDMINPEPTVEEYEKFATVQVEALNHALRGLPQDRIRFHLCWGSWHGPHTTDIPMRDIVDLMLPDGKMVLPGVVSHATNVVEHPELVADRILRFAKLVGRERVIASTDCGLGGRAHPDIAWAKLEALAQGAALASRQLWGKRS